MSQLDSEDYASSDQGSDDNISCKLNAKNSLVLASIDGLVDNVDALIGSGLDVTGDDGRAALRHAAAKGHSAIVISLLKAGAPFDFFEASHAEPGNALMHAAENGCVEIVKLLLAAAGADGDVAAPDRYGKTALLHAAANGHAAVVTSLLSSRCTC